MIRRRLANYRARARRELEDTLEGEYTPHQVAASFAIGMFVTAMPTGGLGIGLFFALGYALSWANRNAMLASVAVLNPFVKPLVYASSVALGAFLLGPEPIAAFGVSSLDRAVAAVQLLLVGNVLVATALSITSYVVVLEWVRSYQRRRLSFSPSSR